MPASYRNGLYVVEDAADFKQIDARLRAEIDDRLFLTWAVIDGQRVYVVLYDRGLSMGPAEICRWPHQLSSGLVDLVKSLRPREGPDLRRAERANAEVEARQLADYDEAVDEIVADVGPRISDKRSAVLRRGVHLRRARARRAS